jgi:hypothetical protein
VAWRAGGLDVGAIVNPSGARTSRCAGAKRCRSATRGAEVPRLSALEAGYANGFWFRPR